MQLTTIFSSDLLERYKSGERIFSNILMQFADFHGNNIQDIHFKNSRLVSLGFNDCNLKNARFTDCEIFFNGFHRSDLTGAIFENCRIDLTFFENVVFNRTKILKSTISYSAMFGTSISEVDVPSSTQFKLFTDPSQMTQTTKESKKTSGAQPSRLRACPTVSACTAPRSPT
jgi:uncharacterized protein YjbI with pentapeptide repeats